MRYVDCQGESDEPAAQQRLSEKRWAKVRSAQKRLAQAEAGTAKSTGHKAVAFLSIDDLWLADYAGIVLSRFRGGIFYECRGPLVEKSEGSVGA